MGGVVGDPRQPSGASLSGEHPLQRFSTSLSRSKLYAILRDRSYIEEVKYQGQWYPGTHKPLVDRVTWNTVQVPLGEIDDKTMAAKATELRDQEAHFKLQLDACDLGRHENGEITVKTFELSQNLREQWFTPDYSVKRRYL